MPIPNYTQYRERVTVTPLRGRTDVYGTKDHAEVEQQLLRAKIESKPQMVRVSSGEEVFVAGRAFILSPTRAITEQDQIQWGDQILPVMRVSSHADPRGRRKVFEVLFGASRRAS